MPARPKAADDRRDDDALRELFVAIADRDRAAFDRLLRARPELATASVRVGASRADSVDWFLAPIGRYAYAGHTALHVAGAAYDVDGARRLLALGADVRARNRRKAEPLHEAAVAGPGSDNWNPAAQRRTIQLLLREGADIEAVDGSGVTALHRAVRTRAGAAVRALLAGGADPCRPNGNGSTPLHLAVLDTGRGGTGTPEARREQRAIITALLAAGARPSDVDAKGATVASRARAPWIHELLATAPD